MHHNSAAGFSMEGDIENERVKAMKELLRRDNLPD